METMKFRKSVHSTEYKVLTSWLVEKRKEAGLTQKGLAEKLGIYHSLVTKAENGERRLDPLELLAYCKAMNADPCELMKILNKTH